MTLRLSSPDVCNSYQVPKLLLNFITIQIFEKYLPNGDVNKMSEALGESLMVGVFSLKNLILRFNNCIIILHCVCCEF